MDEERRQTQDPQPGREGEALPPVRESASPGNDRAVIPWRAWAVSIVAAAVLAAAATLLLGGTRGAGGVSGADNGCTSPCCAPPGAEGK